jgi:hypothetical protein
MLLIDEFKKPNACANILYSWQSENYWLKFDNIIKKFQFTNYHIGKNNV